MRWMIAIAVSLCLATTIASQDKDKPELIPPDKWKTVAVDRNRGNAFVASMSTADLDTRLSSAHVAVVVVGKDKAAATAMVDEVLRILRSKHPSHYRMMHPIDDTTWVIAQGSVPVDLSKNGTLRARGEIAYSLIEVAAWAKPLALNLAPK